MYAINIAPQNSQKCQFCQNTLIEYIGTQAWCFDCKKAIKTIQQEVKVVPKMYQSNSKEKQSSAEIKIKTYLNEFCNKYGGVSDNEEINFMYRQALELKNKKGLTTKNYRQNCASVVYVHYKDIHRLSIKEFCKKNQIDLKSFNKSYLIYQKLLRQKQKMPNPVLQTAYQNKIKHQTNQEDLKFQYTNEEESDQQNQGENFTRSAVDYERHNSRDVYSCELNSSLDVDPRSQQGRTAKFQNSNVPLKNTHLGKNRLNNLTLVNQSRSFLDVVFDSFFSSLYYKQKKSLLIKELSEQIVDAYLNFKQILHSCEPSQFISLQCSINDSNFFKYFLYFILRKLSHRISQVNYRKIIKDVTGQLIKCTVLKQIIKFFQSKQETVSFSGDSMFFIENSGTTGSQFVKIQEKE